ncbi:helix-turn-helix domain-containing protein [Rhodococcus sp. ACS1]|nr:helix-turn-helix domain-containing protein [Rhodococcus sp. ACS1]
MQVFWQQGFRATSPQNLVDALGIGRGSLYNTFGSNTVSSSWR